MYDAVVTQYGIGKTFFNFRKPLLGEVFHIFPFAEIHAPGGTGQDARGEHTLMHPVVAEVALVDLLCLRVNTRDIIGAGFAHGLAVKLGGQGREQHRARLLVLHDGAVDGRSGHARGQFAMAALFREEQHPEVLSLAHFAHVHGFVGHAGQVRRVRVSAAVRRFLGGQVLPLLARDLAASAARAARQVDKKAFAMRTPLSGGGAER